ncbi:hypothetical protein PINS_up014748 [Pythium insidiosum]|nr:hypothetical protein PINS_up014748 [Pythium insidiosum]
MAKGTKGHGAGGSGKKAAPKKKSKLVITFDAEKRKEFLTGFRKRKQERRRFGLDMEAFKQKKKLLEARKQRREEKKELLAKYNIKDDSDDDAAAQTNDADVDSDVDDDDDEDDDDENQAVGVTKVMKFDDEHTQAKFGDVVTVTTSVGDLPSDSEDNLSDLDDDDEDDDEETGGRQQQQQSKFKGKGKNSNEMTLFQRIQLKRRGLALPTKRSKIKQAREARKAMVGASGKKGGKKGAKAAVGKRGARDSDKADSGPSVGGAGGKKKFSNKRRKH